MKYCSNGRFLNEQTYLDTVCKRKKPCKVPPNKHKSCEYVEYTCQTKCGKLRLRCDECGTNVELELNRCCNPKCCDKNRDES